MNCQKYMTLPSGRSVNNQPSSFQYLHRLTIWFFLELQIKNRKTISWGIWKRWGMNIWDKEIYTSVIQCQKQRETFVVSHRANILHIRELRCCNINAYLMGLPHVKDHRVFIYVVIRNISDNVSDLSGHQILENK